MFSILIVMNGFVTPKTSDGDYLSVEETEVLRDLYERLKLLPETIILEELKKLNPKEMDFIMIYDEYLKALYEGRL